MSHIFKSRKINRNTVKPVILFLALIPILAFNLHKEYYSLTKIDFNQEEKSLQITMRLFTDDIDQGLNTYFDKKFQLNTPNELSETDTYLLEYLKQKFYLDVNSKPASYKFLGKEYEKDVVFLYMEIIQIEEVKTIQITNNVLTDIYYEQENIVKININDLYKSLILTKKNDKGMLNF